MGCRLSGQTDETSRRLKLIRCDVYRVTMGERGCIARYTRAKDAQEGRIQPGRTSFIIELDPCKGCSQGAARAVNAEVQRTLAARPGTIRAKLLELLSDGRPHTTSEIINYVGKPWGSIYNALRDLLRKGATRRIGKGVYVGAFSQNP